MHYTRVLFLLAAVSPIFAQPSIATVVNGASFAPVITAGSWITITGTNLADTTQSWSASDIVNGQLPTTLANVTVAVDGLPAYISYVSPTQINAQAPDDSNTGLVSVVVTTAEGSSAPVNADLEPSSPGLFLWPGQNVVAQHSADYSDAGPANLFQGLTTTPASPGETIILYGTGFGATYPPAPSGQVALGSPPLPSVVNVTINGEQTAVTFAGLVAGSAGLYQLNVVVPSNAPSGNLPIVVYYLGAASESGAVLAVSQ